jgi:transcriptional regulator with XRE-family HTH domain
MTGGNVILMARRRAHLTQRELATRLSCRQATVARWERGDRQPAFQDVQDVVGACGLQLDAHLLSEDRSWWPQIAAQLELTPAERVRQLSPSAALVDVVAMLEALAETRVPVIVIGELAGALHGWPLVLSGEAIEVCAREQAVGSIRQRLSAADANARALASGGRLVITETPPATSGYGDVARDAETVEVTGGTVQVAGLLDLLRIADASLDADAHRHALAYGAVLDVQRARGELRTADSHADQERIQAWLSQQIPVA